MHAHEWVPLKIARRRTGGSSVKGRSARRAASAASALDDDGTLFVETAIGGTPGRTESVKHASNRALAEWLSPCSNQGFEGCDGALSMVGRALVPHLVDGGPARFDALEPCVSTSTWK